MDEIKYYEFVPYAHIRTVSELHIPSEGIFIDTHTIQFEQLFENKYRIDYKDLRLYKFKKFKN